MHKCLIPLPLFMSFLAGAQQAPAPDNQSSQMSAYASQREALMAPGYEAMRRKDYATALVDFRKVLEKYPKDDRLLMTAGDAAWAAGKLEEAAEYFRRCQERPGRYPWSVRFSLLQVDVALGQWDEFAQWQAAIEKAAISGDPQLAESLNKGYQIEQFRIGPQSILVLAYPDPGRTNGIRYSFFFGGVPATPETFTPHWNLIVIPGDSHSFSLVQYSEPEKSTIIQSYTGGEPTYQEVRDEVLRLLKEQFNTTEINSCFIVCKQDTHEVETIK
jgi:tetratricopeptide (TPR) repeat protein